MPILLDCRMQDWTGVGRYTVSLTTALARRGDIDFVQVVEAGSTPPVLDAPSIEAEHPVLSIAGFRELGSIVRRANPDLTHCVQYPTPVPAAHPLVVTLHDVIPLTVPATMPSALKRAVYRRMNMRAVKVADRIITVSRHAAGDLARYLGADPDITRVVLPAPDEYLSGPAGELPTVLSSPYIFAMGITKPHKNLATLLAAFARFSPEHPGYQLALLGTPDPAFLVAHVPDATVRARIRFTGRVDDATLRALYAGAEIFVFPSRYEGFGLPPLEAMGFGVPVICSNAASLPEVVGDAALLFAPEDTDALVAHLTLLAGDPALRARMSEASRARARLFSWDKAAAETVEVYRELL